MKKQYARKLMDKTRSDYDLIARSFSRTRQALWPGMVSFKRYVKSGDRVLDVGCGNGRLRKLFKELEVEYVGVDNSQKLIKLARQSEGLRIDNQRFLVADGLNLPFDKNQFNVVFAVAVLHHIPSKDFRLKFLKEAGRVLKPRGFLIVLVWNLWRVRFVKNHCPYLLLKLLGAGQLDWKDIFYPWKNSQGKTLASRYIHCFTKRELVNLTKQAGLRIQDSGVTDNKSNIYVVARPSLNG